MERFDEIKRKLAELRQLDSRLELWGAPDHGYRLCAPITQRELRRREEQCGVTFPESYVAFLLELGNGGAGPGVGLYTLGDAVSKFEEHGDRCDKHHYIRPRLDLPFPATTMLTEAICKAREQATRQWREQSPKDMYAFMKWPKLSMPDNIDGVMYISDDHCSAYHLVTTGEQRGNVWLMGGPASWLPCHDDANQLDFLDWYESWLDESLKPETLERLKPGAFEKWENQNRGNA